MTAHEEQKIEAQLDPYLKSPKSFHLEMPLYHELDLSIGGIAEKVYTNLSHSGTMDAYCIWCGKESVFNAEEHFYGKQYGAWKGEEFGFRRNSYKCTRNNNHRYYIYFFKGQNVFLKVGQWPSAADFQIPQAEKYRKILGEEEYKEFTRGIGLSAHGVGIGSFVYLRRVFENLIEEAHARARAENKEFSDEDYMRARMDHKIEMVRGCLPEFLVENRALYAILSKGIHDLSEDECLQYFETVKIGIEQILDEKIIAKEKADKAAVARAAIQKAHGKIKGS